MVKRVLLGFAALSIAGLFLVLGATPASAHVNGGCTGSGAFEKGGFTATAAEEGVVNVPLQDTVTLGRGIEPATPGKIGLQRLHPRVDLPPPFAPLKIDSWSGTSDSTGNNGVKKYSLPDFVPRGVEFDVSGHHDQGAVHCDGSVKLTIQGGKFGPLTIGSLVLTALTGGLFAFAGRPKVGG